MKSNIEMMLMGALVALGMLIVATLTFQGAEVPGVIETVITLCVGALAGAAIPTRGRS